MRNQNFNILHSLTEAQARTVREVVIEMVLSTDMGLHAKIMGVCVRACVRACPRARACVCVCVCAWHVCVRATGQHTPGVCWSGMAAPRLPWECRARGARTEIPCVSR